MIPQWLSKKRQQTCGACNEAKACQVKFRILEQSPECPLEKLHSIDDELRWAKAWPETAPRVSGCCDSALHYSL